MGDPKRLRKKYSTPRHPWVAQTIEVEKVLTKDYGLKNKREIWKMSSILKDYKDQAKKLIAVKTVQGEKEKKQMMDKLYRLGLVKEQTIELDDVLSLELKDILERRLQTLVFRQGLSRSAKQARQFITHEHIFVGDKKITFPSYLVSKEEEGKIGFDINSSLKNEEHPERVNLANKGLKEEAEAVRPKKKASGKKKEKAEEGEKNAGKN